MGEYLRNGHRVAAYAQTSGAILMIVQEFVLL